MIFCTYCGHQFSRDEHLERHILTHTQIKPFKCFTCHMSFARRDLLQRHYTVHGRNQDQEAIPAADGMIPKSAGRTPIACSNCAKTKTKCDKKFPCSRCASRNLRCTMRPTRRSTKGAIRTADGLLIPPGQTISIEPGAQPVQHSTSPPYQQPLSAKPESPKSGTFSSPEDKQSQTHSGNLGQPASGMGPALHHESSSLFPNPRQGFPPHNASDAFQPGHDGFSATSKDESDISSPLEFMADWSQLQVPLDGDALVHPGLLMDDARYDPELTPLAPALPSGSDGMLGIMPDLANGFDSIMTPLETPELEQGFSSMELELSEQGLPTRGHMSRQSTSSSSTLNGELAPIVAAQDAWSVFRCTPTVPSMACPKTQRLNLERLEQTLQNHEGWSTWSPQWTESEFAGEGDNLAVVRVDEGTKDKLLAITQSFLHKALEIHKESSTQSSPVNHQSHSSNNSSNFVLLPPAWVLECFLRSYANCFEKHYPLSSRGIVDVNELMHCYNDRAASLLVLLMVAQGAMNVPSVEARMLTGGLTEACRISLFDLIERNIIMSGDPIVLHSALLFVVQAAWSGDKWQMDIAMGQKGMYLAMLSHSGVLESRQSSSSDLDQNGLDLIWSEWIHNESRSRLVYSWIMVDQELSLFHDSALGFSVTDIGTPMPDADHLWHAKSALEWSNHFEQVHNFISGYPSVGSGARPLSLRDLFRHFLDDELVALGIEMTPLQMRLLLHPLQGLVCQYRQLLSCFSDDNRNQVSHAVTSASTRVRLEEVQALLKRWNDLAERYLKANPVCATMQTSLVIFHLISLNAVTIFPEIEKLARREDWDGSYQQLLGQQKRCITDVEEAIVHSGQILRLVRSIPRRVRPPWWAGAIYRACLTLWTESLTNKDTETSVNGMYTVPGPSLAIDSLPFDHPLVVRYLEKREGVPWLTKRDGSQRGVDSPSEVLQHCIELIGDGAATRFSDGVRGKLDRLTRP